MSSADSDRQKPRSLLDTTKEVSQSDGSNGSIEVADGSSSSASKRDVEQPQISTIAPFGPDAINRCGRCFRGVCNAFEPGMSVALQSIEPKERSPVRLCWA
ncbi:unnamed protein product [Polarella glacialis]|uniref:Uncharacterized protein n=1 Tax=Polarella glacialis TaxID=89957 RepID=A0A813KM53_POLGL|nr:unnamed protein product [Polarella glacialis]